LTEDTLNQPKLNGSALQEAFREPSLGFVVSDTLIFVPPVLLPAIWGVTQSPANAVTIGIISLSVLQGIVGVGLKYAQKEAEALGQEKTRLPFFTKDIETKSLEHAPLRAIGYIHFGHLALLAFEGQPLIAFMAAMWALGDIAAADGMDKKSYYETLKAKAKDKLGSHFAFAATNHNTFFAAGVTAGLFTQHPYAAMAGAAFVLWAYIEQFQNMQAEAKQIKEGLKRENIKLPHKPMVKLGMTLTTVFCANAAMEIIDAVTGSELRGQRDAVQTACDVIANFGLLVIGGTYFRLANRFEGFRYPWQKQKPELLI
jgi:hypothetical protein